MNRIILPLCFLLLAVVFETGLAQTETGKTRSVRVRGTGSVSMVPDQVRLSMQVTSQGASASDAMRTTSDRSREVISLLRSHGVGEKEIKTTRISVSPVYDREKRTQPPPIVGYTAGHDITALFKGDAMKQLGEFIDRAVSAGASNFGSLIYESSQEKEMERQALAEAARDARARAEGLAGVLGAAVGKVLSVSESGMTPPPPVTYDMRIEGAMAAPVMAGEMEVQASVDVEFELVETR